MNPAPRHGRDLSTLDDVAVKAGPLSVVVIDEELPWPPTSGKRIRTMGLLSRLAAKHRITFVAHRNADEEEAARAETHFESLGIRTVLIDRVVPPKSGLAFYGRLALNLLSPLPYSVQSHTSPEMAAALEDIARTESPDLWHVEWTPYAQVLRGVPGRRLVMAHNVESVIWQRYAETETNPLKRWYIRRQWLKFREFERAAVREADLTVAVSDTDATRFRNDFDGERIDVVDNGVDVAKFVPPTSPRDPATLLFLGSLEWRPNLDGVRQLLDVVFPAIRARRPDAKLQLVGRNPPDWLRAAANPSAGIEVHADVPDVVPYLHRATMMLVPLRIGGGSRLKILESLATATPVVSTLVGAEGLHLESGLHLDLVEDNADMADAVVRALDEPWRATAQAEAGRRQVLRLYDWGVLSERLEKLWRRIAGAETNQGGHP